MQQRRRLNSAPTRVHPMLAAILAVAMVATAAVGGRQILQVQSVAPADVDIYSSTESLAAGSDILVNDAAILTQGDEVEEVYRVVKEFTRDREFNLFALTWSGDRDVAAFVRAERPGGGWSEWYEMDNAVAPTGAEKFGTEPIYVEATKRIQVSLGNVDLLEGGRALSDAPTTARDLNAVFIDGGTGTVNGGIQPVVDSYTRGMPKVITRAQWGAGASSRPTYTEPVTAATVHHTAGSNNYSQAEAPGIVRGIWRYHAKDLGWGDMGYNALVDKYGNIYEGRAGGLDRAVQGAHVGGFNQNTWGVSVLGNYQTASPTPASINALAEIIGWKAAVAGFDPTGSSYQRSEFTFRGTKYPQGQGAMFPNINAHRDFHYNDCPGDNLYSRMGEIRRLSKVKYTQVKAGMPASNGLGNLSTLLGEKPTQTQTQTQTQPRTESVTDPDGTTTTVTNTGSSDTAILTGLAEGDPVAIAAVVGTVAGVGLVWAFQQGLLDDAIKNVAGTELLAGYKVKDITPLIGPALKLLGANEIADAWNKVEPALGEVVGAASGTAGTQMVFYSNGIAVQNSRGEIFALVGKIADAWLQQGLDLGPLGLPVASQRTDAATNEARVDFEGGAIVYDPATNTVNIITN